MYNLFATRRFRTRRHRGSGTSASGDRLQINNARAVVYGGRANDASRPPPAIPSCSVNVGPPGTRSPIARLYD